MEIWKDIKGYEGLYQVSNLGRVRSLNYRKTGITKILKDSKKSERYCKVCLVKDGMEYRVRTHRIVAETFIPNPENKREVDHINTNTKDNRVCNLRWVDRKENCNNPNTIKKHINGKNSKQILQYTISGEFVREWPSSSECGRNGFDNSSVIKCCRGKLKQFKGFQWKYKERVV